MNSKKKGRPSDFDDSLYVLANNIKKTIELNNDGSTQEKQVDTLLAYEIKFRDSITKYKQCNNVYKRFIQKIKLENKNILSAKPYFRETSNVFGKISQAIKDDDIETLKIFHINFGLIHFIRSNWLGPFPHKSDILYNKVKRARNVLIENNMPLAINRAKLFYRKTPKSHLLLEDFIDICALGLANGIDKWVGKYKPVFRSVCIGRMVGNLIEAYSETVLHFYPVDRRIIYKANSIKGRRGIEDIEELANAVNAQFEEEGKPKNGKPGKSVPKKITAAELAPLMASISAISSDSMLNDEGGNLYEYTPGNYINIEEALINREKANKVMELANSLPLINKKILRLKGIDI